MKSPTLNYAPSTKSSIEKPSATKIAVKVMMKVADDEERRTERQSR
jgi:hypothetical protein